MMNFNSNTSSSSTTPASFPISNQQQQVPAVSAGISQQQAPKINDDKTGAPQVNSPQHQQQQQALHSASQNNNHGLGGTIQQQLINMHSQQINRNLNVSNQQMNKGGAGGNQFISSNYHYKQFVTNTGQKMQPSNQFAYQQSQQQQQQILPPSTSASLQIQNVQHSLVNQNQQNYLQKIQAAIPAAPTSMQPQQQQQQHSQQHLQMKMTNINYSSGNQGPPSIAVTSGNQSVASTPLAAAATPGNQHTMQFSPTKSTPSHPQMKTTAKLMSPGSQLQKSPPTQQPQSAVASQNKTVPLPVGSNVTAPSVASTAATVAQPPPPSSQITQAPISTSLNKPSLSSSSTLSASAPTPATTNTNTTNNNHSNSNATNSVPSSQIAPTPENKPDTVVTTAAAAALPPSVAPVVQNKSPAKPVVEEKKPAVHSSPAAVPAATPASIVQNKAAPTKTAAEEKKAAIPSSPVAAVENASKVEKPVTSPSSNIIPKASAMRLATVAAPTRKKPPPTITKKVTATSAQQKTARSIQPPVPSEPIKQAAAVSVTSKKSQETSPKSSTTGPVSNVTPKTKRVRTKVQPYQSPTPEIALVTKLSTQVANPSKNGDDKLTIFYKNEFLAVRNGEGTFYLCQTMHNVYKSSPKIRIRWLNEKSEGKVNKDGGRVYNLDFYDLTDFECVLTTVDLEKIDGKTFELPKEELARIESILKKAIDVEKGVVPRPDVTEENPDGLDLSLYKDESQLDKISSSRKRKSKKSESDEDSDLDDEPVKKKTTKTAATPAPKKVLTPRSTAKKPIVEADSSESDESDEENLMEIKKKAKNQQLTPAKTVQQPTPSSSKEQKTQANTAGRGRKRSAPVPAVTEKSAKVIKVDKVVEEKKQPVTPTKNISAAETKTPPKGKAVGNKKSEIATTPSQPPSAVEKKKEEIEEKTSTKDKKPVVEKKQQSPAKQKKGDDKPAPAPSSSPITSPTKKKTLASASEKVNSESSQSSSVVVSKSSPAKARNTRSKK